MLKSPYFLYRAEVGQNGQPLSGFEVATYVQQIGLFRAYRLARAAQARVRRGEFTTAIARTVALDDAPGELARYAQQMSQGKVLIVPDQK